MRALLLLLALPAAAWASELELARQAAERENKPLMVVFRCVP
ncbi:MAG: hypothetical protein AAGD14_05995 [Planctomycetota bacterium]